jgi:hypothetical protein
MPDKMMIFEPVKHIEQNTNTISYASGQKQQESGIRYCPENTADEKADRPSHSQIDQYMNFNKAIDPYSLECDPDNCQ